MRTTTTVLHAVLCLALVIALGGCHVPPGQPPPEQAARVPYWTEADGTVTLCLSALVGGGKAVRLKRGGEPDEQGNLPDDEVLLGEAQVRLLFAAVDKAMYGSDPQPMPDGAKGYLWAVRVSDGSTDSPSLFYFLDMQTRVTVVVLEDGAQFSLSMEADQGKGLALAFAGIAADAGMPAADAHPPAGTPGS